MQCDPDSSDPVKSSGCTCFGGVVAVLGSLGCSQPGVYAADPSTALTPPPVHLPLPPEGAPGACRPGPHRPCWLGRGLGGRFRGKVGQDSRALKQVLAQNDSKAGKTKVFKPLEASLGPVCGLPSAGGCSRLPSMPLPGVSWSPHGLTRPITSLVPCHMLVPERWEGGVLGIKNLGGLGRGGEWGVECVLNTMHTKM